jgi:hypothetical protein
MLRTSLAGLVMVAALFGTACSDTTTLYGSATPRTIPPPSTQRVPQRTAERVTATTAIAEASSTTATSTVPETFTVTGDMINNMMTQVLAASPFVLDLPPGTATCVRPDMYEQQVLQLDPPLILAKQSHRTNGVVSQVLQQGKLFVNAVDVCGDPLTGEMVDALTGSVSQGNLTSGLSASQRWFTVESDWLTKPSRRETRLVAMLRSLATSKTITFGPPGDSVLVYWTDEKGNHEAHLSMDASRIQSLRSNEFGKDFWVGFGRTVDVVSVESLGVPDDAPLVDAQRFLNAQNGVKPARNRQPSATTQPNTVSPLKLPDAAPGPLLPTGEVVLSVQQGRGMNTVTLSLESTGRVVAEVHEFPGNAPQPIMWMVPPTTVKQLETLMSGYTLYELPQDADYNDQWIRVTYGGQSAQGMNVDDAPHNTLFALADQILESLINERSASARPAPPAVITAQVTNRNDANLIGYVMLDQWPLARQLDWVFTKGTDGECQTFTGTEAEQLWTVLGPKNSTTPNGRFEDRNNVVWDISFSTYFTLRPGC